MHDRVFSSRVLPEQRICWHSFLFAQQHSRYAVDTYLIQLSPSAAAYTVFPLCFLPTAPVCPGDRETRRTERQIHMT